MLRHAISVATTGFCESGYCKTCFDLLQPRMLVEALLKRRSLWLVAAVGRKFPELVVRVRLQCVDCSEVFGFSNGGRAGGAETLVSTQRFCQLAEQPGRGFRLAEPCDSEEHLARRTSLNFWEDFSFLFFWRTLWMRSRR